MQGCGNAFWLQQRHIATSESPGTFSSLINLLCFTCRFELALKMSKNLFPGSGPKIDTPWPGCMDFSMAPGRMYFKSRSLSHWHYQEVPLINKCRSLSPFSDRLERGRAAALWECHKIHRPVAEDHTWPWATTRCWPQMEISFFSLHPVGLPQLEVRSWCQCTAVLLNIFIYNGGPRSPKLISSGIFCIHRVMICTPLNSAGLRCKYLCDWKPQPMEVQWPFRFNKKDKPDIYILYFQGTLELCAVAFGTTFLKCWHWAIKKKKENVWP